MAATRRNITIEQHAKWVMEQFVHKDSSGAIVDLTGYSADMHVRRSPLSDDLLMELTTQSGDITLGGPAGTIDAVALSAKTSLLPAGSWLYDLVIESPGGEKTRVLEGTAIVSAGITQT